MSLEALRDQIPDYARDIRLNLSAIATIATLSPQQLWGTVLASAIASRGTAMIAAAEAEAEKHLSPEAASAARSAAAIMAMNNVYYRFLYLTKDESYGKMPARLRMNVIANPGVPKQDFELWALAVSAINGCGTCVDSHEKVLRQHGIGQDAIQDAVRVAAIIQAAAVTLETAVAGAATAAAAAA